MGVLCNTHVHLRQVPNNSPSLLGALEPEAEASYNPVFRVVAQLQRRPEEAMTSDKSLGSDQVDSGCGRREYLSDDSISLHWLCLTKHPLIYVL